MKKIIYAVLIVHYAVEKMSLNTNSNIKYTQFD